MFVYASIVQLEVLQYAISIHEIPALANLIPLWATSDGVDLLEGATFPLHSVRDSAALSL